MFFHHYSEVNKLREKFAQSVKNKGQIRSSIWGVGFYSGFWAEYIPLFPFLGQEQPPPMHLGTTFLEPRDTYCDP